MLLELGAATVLFTLPLEESSGLAVDGDRVLTVEDSGGPSTVFAYGRDGVLREQIPVDAENVDWEDLAVADGALWVGDVGDNRARRDDVAVHRVPLEGGPTTTYRLTWADGPRDAESLVVAGGTVGVVSKELLGAGLYLAPLRDGAVLERVADVPVVLATGAALSPDGTLLAVRDYAGVTELPLAVPFDLTTVGGEGTRSTLPAVEQGEAITYDGSRDAVLTSTEGAGGPVHRLTRDAPAAPGGSTRTSAPLDRSPAGERGLDDRLLQLGALSGGALVLAVGALLVLRRRRP